MTSGSDTFCKICGETAFFLDVVDFNKSCMAHFNANEPLSGIPVYYHGCPACDFIFTTRCDSWTLEGFKSNIYNDRYVECDPGFTRERQVHTANWFEQQFPHFRILKNTGFFSFRGFEKELLPSSHTQHFANHPQDIENPRSPEPENSGGG